MIKNEYIAELKRDFESLIKQMNTSNHQVVLDAIYLLAKNTRTLLTPDSTQVNDCNSEILDEAAMSKSPQIREQEINSGNLISEVCEEEINQEQDKLDCVSKDAVTKVEFSEIEYTAHLNKNGLEGRREGCTPIFINEFIARNKNIQPGDRVVFKEKSPEDEISKYPYYVDIVSTNNSEPKSEFETFEMGIVEKRDNNYVVSKNANGLSLPFTYIIPAHKVDKLRINDGDLVDIRYDRNNKKSSEASLIWKHAIENDNLRTESSRMLEHRASVENEDVSGEMSVQENKFLEDTRSDKKYKNKKVLLVGMEMKTTEFRDQLKHYDSEMSVYGSNKASKRLRQAVQKSDVVIVAKSHNSHSNGDEAKKYAKKYGKHYNLFYGFSPNQFINAYIKAIQDT